MAEPFTFMLSNMSQRSALARSCAFFSSVSGADKGYKIAVYSLKIILVRLIATRGEKDVLVQRIRAFVNPLSDTRMVMRFFGLLPILDGLSQKTSQTDPLLQRIERLQLYAMLVYYPTEHVYWLGSHKVLDIEQADKWSRWSCRAWAVYILLDLVAIYHQLQPLNDKIRIAADPKQQKQLEEERDELVIRATVCMADLPMALHWSLASYPLSDLTIGTLGLISAVGSTYLKWKYTN